MFPDDFIYSISWEDEQKDHDFLNINSNDSVLRLTGGGDNAFNFLLKGAKKVYCVDLNPAQYHLMELKKTCIKHSNYNKTWQLFGEGTDETFREYLNNFLRPFLNENTKQFWARKSWYFDQGLYFQGSMGKIVKLFKLLRIYNIVCKNQKITKDKNENENEKVISIYDYLEYSYVKSWLYFYQCIISIFCMFCGNSFFMWNIFGVPNKQLNMIIQHDKRYLSEYVLTSVNNVIEHTDIINDNHYYYLVLNGKFTHKNCPDYLKEENYNKLKTRVDDLINVNDSFLNVLNEREYNKIILMDHLDWVDEKYVKNITSILKNKMSLNNGVAILRSASIYPWYIDLIKKDFKVTKITDHIKNPYSDRVNTYASFWKIEHENNLD